MNYIADLHTHTIASDHAYSTLLENVEYAKRAGMQALAITDHGPGVEDAPHLWHLLNMKSLPREIEGVRILRGVEANIMDMEGNLDIEGEVLSQLDWVIASFHAAACPPGTVEQNTRAYLGAARNPYVDLIGHSGQLSFPYDYEAVVKVCKEYDKVMEINESSTIVRVGSEHNCAEIARLCKKYEVKIAVNSDAHFALSVGRYPNSSRMLEEIGFPEKLVLNADLDRLMGYIKDKKIIHSIVSTVQKSL